jgi:hypothetical protein
MAFIAALSRVDGRSGTRFRKLGPSPPFTRGVIGLHFPAFAHYFAILAVI